MTSLWNNNISQYTYKKYLFIGSPKKNLPKRVSHSSEITLVFQQKAIYISYYVILYIGLIISWFLLFFFTKITSSIRKNHLWPTKCPKCCLVFTFNLNKIYYILLLFFIILKSLVHQTRNGFQIFILTSYIPYHKNSSYAKQMRKIIITFSTPLLIKIKEKFLSWKKKLQFRINILI